MSHEKKEKELDLGIEEIEDACEVTFEPKKILMVVTSADRSSPRPAARAKMSSIVL